MAPAFSCVNENAGAFKFNLLHKKPHFSRDATRGQCHIRRKEILHTLCKRVVEFDAFARVFGFGQRRAHKEFAVTSKLICA